MEKVITKDTEIQKGVMAELATIPFIKITEIGIAVKNGIVSLSGLVDSYPKKITIEKAVKKITGVKGIVEALEVSIEGSNKKTDNEIAQIVMNVLEWNATHINDLKILVEDSCVTLEGSVSWDFQRKEATTLVGNIVGVKGIINNIKLDHKPTSLEVKNKIQEAFMRNANIDANKITIKTEGSKVYITGTVNSWSEYEEAERSVWATPGVSAVENKLEFEDDF